jgi:HAD superfamily hydrolase (TIGR01549 family)
MSYEAITFDLWFTLIWSEDDIYDEFTRLRIDSIYRSISKIDDNITLEKVIDGYISLEDYRMTVPPIKLMKLLLTKLGCGNVDISFIEDMASDYESIVSYTLPHVNEEALEIIPSLYDRGIKIGIITNTSFPTRSIHYILDKMGIKGYIDTVIASCDVEVTKPDPRIFKLALEELGVEAERAIHVGDNYYDDALGAKKVGIKPLLYTGLWHTYNDYRYATWGMVDRVEEGIEIINSLKEILSFI